MNQPPVLCDAQADRLIIGHFDIHPKESRRECLTLGVRHKTYSAAAAKRSVEKEIQSLQIREFESFDGPFYHRAEMSLYCRGGYFANENRIDVLFERDHANIGGIAFISGTRMRELYELNFHQNLVLYGYGEFILLVCSLTSHRFANTHAVAHWP